MGEVERVRGGQPINTLAGSLEISRTPVGFRDQECRTKGVNGSREKRAAA